MTLDTIRQMIIEITNCSEDEVEGKTILKEDLGMDSLDAMELVMLIEEKTGLSIPEEKLPEFITVDDIVNYVNSAMES
ncbi:MAG: acyl carrier protein [Eubacterium sp.]|nr:acyl carrier protein [Eubacterium sp.]